MAPYPAHVPALNSQPRPGEMRHPAESLLSMWGGVEVLPYVDPLLSEPGLALPTGVDAPTYRDPRAYSREMLANPAVADPWRYLRDQAFEDALQVVQAERRPGRSSIPARQLSDAAEWLVSVLEEEWKRALVHFAGAFISGYAPAQLVWSDAPRLYKRRPARVVERVRTWEEWLVRITPDGDLVWSDEYYAAYRWRAVDVPAHWVIARHGSTTSPYGASALGAAGWVLHRISSSIDRGVERLSVLLGAIEADQGNRTDQDAAAFQAELREAWKILKNRGINIKQPRARIEAMQGPAVEADKLADLRRKAADNLRMLIQGSILTAEAASSGGKGTHALGQEHRQSGMLRACQLLEDCVIPAARDLLTAGLRSLYGQDLDPLDLPTLQSPLQARMKRPTVGWLAEHGGEVDIEAYADAAGVSPFVRPAPARPLVPSYPSAPAAVSISAKPGEGGESDAQDSESMSDSAASDSSATAADTDQAVRALARRARPAGSGTGPLWQEVRRAAGEPDVPGSVLARWRRWIAARDAIKSGAAQLAHQAIAAHALALGEAWSPAWDAEETLAADPSLAESRAALVAALVAASAQVMRDTLRFWASELGTDGDWLETRTLTRLQAATIGTGGAAAPYDDEDPFRDALFGLSAARVAEVVITCYEWPFAREVGGDPDRIGPLLPRWGSAGYEGASSAMHVTEREILQGATRAAWHEVRRLLGAHSGDSGAGLWPYVAYLAAAGGRLPELVGVVYDPWSFAGERLRPPHGWGSTAEEIPVSAAEAEIAGYRGDVPRPPADFAALAQKLDAQATSEGFPWWLFRAEFAALAAPNAFVGC